MEMMGTYLCIFHMESVVLQPDILMLQMEEV